MQAQTIQDIYYIPAPAPQSEIYYLGQCIKKLVSLAKVSETAAADILAMTIVHGGQIISPVDDYRERCKAPQNWILPEWYADNWVPLRTIPAMIQGKKEVYWALRESSHPKLKDEWYLIIAE